MQNCVGNGLRKLICYCYYLNLRDVRTRSWNWASKKCMKPFIKWRQINVLIVGGPRSGKSEVLSIVKSSMDHDRMEEPLVDENNNEVSVPSVQIPVCGLSACVPMRNSDLMAALQISEVDSYPTKWAQWYGRFHGFIFVLDTTDRHTIREGYNLFEGMLKDENVKGKPILLVASHNDIIHLQDIDFVKALKLNDLVTDAKCFTCVHMYGKGNTEESIIEESVRLQEDFYHFIRYIRMNYSNLDRRVQKCADTAITTVEEDKHNVSLDNINHDMKETTCNEFEHQDYRIECVRDVYLQKCSSSKDNIAEISEYQPPTNQDGKNWLFHRIRLNCKRKVRPMVTPNTFCSDAVSLTSSNSKKGLFRSFSFY